MIRSSLRIFIVGSASIQLIEVLHFDRVIAFYKLKKCVFFLIRSVYIVYTVLGDVSIYVVGKDEYDELACKYILHSLCIQPKFVRGEGATNLNVLLMKKYIVFILFGVR